ncbi:MAG: family 3 encapsulin nanocompartment shell protein [Jatrophihabitantaceae bacterium]
MTTPDAGSTIAHDATRATPGQQFVAALAEAGGSEDLTVAIDAHLPGAFPLFASRPRYPVRHLLNTASVDREGPAVYIYEPSAQRREDSGTTYAATPEATFLPELREAELSDLTVSVSLPPTILGRDALLTTFIDRRVLVRTATMENQVLLRGSEDGKVPGLLDLPGMRRRNSARSLDEAVTEVAFEVEETGGSCDGIVTHPAVYWEMVRQGLLARLSVAGVVVSRTRMIARNTMLLGDFQAAVTLLLPHVNELSLRRGAGAGGEDVIQARTRLGLAVHVPQHLIELTWSGSDS